MIEIQGDAGGRRFVATIPKEGTPKSFDAMLTTGQEWHAMDFANVPGDANGKPVQALVPTPFLVDASKLESYFLHATQPVELLIGDRIIPLSPSAPRIWFREWGDECPLKADEPQTVSAIAGDLAAHLTLIFVT